MGLKKENTQYSSIGIKVQTVYKSPVAIKKADDLKGGSSEEIAMAINEVADVMGIGDPMISKLARKAGREVAEGFREAIIGLDKLFTPKNTFGIGLVFDEDTYREAKPHFERTLEQMIQSGKTLGELIHAIFSRYGIEIRPYLQRFLEEKASESLQTTYKPESLAEQLRRHWQEFRPTAYKRIAAQGQTELRRFFLIIGTQAVEQMNLIAARQTKAGTDPVMALRMAEELVMHDILVPAEDGAG